MSRLASTGAHRLRMAWLVGMALIVAASPVFGQTVNLTLQWDPNPEANLANYKVYVGPSSGSYTLPVATVPKTQTTYVFAATPGVRYYFAVTAVNTLGFESPFSNEATDLIPIGIFTDDPLTPGVHVMRAVHINELRTRINNLRTANGLPAASWTNPTLSNAVAIRAVHLTELRSALNAVYTARSLPLPVYQDSSPATGITVIKAAHITQLRAAVIALE